LIPFFSVISVYTTELPPVEIDGNWSWFCQAYASAVQLDGPDVMSGIGGWKLRKLSASEFTMLKTTACCPAISPDRALPLTQTGPDTTRGSQPSNS
jgi:hypothetical protein